MFIIEIMDIVLLTRRLILAKKWQDVEFVDYKERQRRKRMRKRQNVQKEIVQEVENKWNFMIIGGIGSTFIIAILFGLSTFFAEQEVSDDAKVKSYLESIQYTGDTFYRKLAGDDWVHFVEPKKFFDSWQFKTGVDSDLQLKTFDEVVFIFTKLAMYKKVKNKKKIKEITPTSSVNLEVIELIAL